MTREDSKDLTLSILVVVVAMLAVDCVWLHCKCSAQQVRIENLEDRIEVLADPPKDPTIGEKTKDAYDKAKNATVREYNRVKAAASAGYHAAKDELTK